MITKDQLHQIMPGATLDNLEKFCAPLNEAMVKFEINNACRVAAFVAQLAHESGQFHYVVELASGEAYEERKDLGNIEPGDGVRFKGRGLIQITGRANYAALSKALGFDFIAEPEKLELPLFAVESAGWFWKNHGLNELADVNDFVKITKRINGGVNGLDQRVHFWGVAKTVLSC